MADPTHWLARAMARVVRHPRKIVALALVAVAAVVPLLATQLGVNTRTTDMFDADLPWRQNFIAFREAFPERVNNILVVIDAQAPELAARVQARLAAALRSRAGANASANKKNRLFASVETPGSGEFFERHGLLFLSPEALADRIDALARAQPFIGRLRQAPNLAGLATVLSDAVTQGGGSQTPVANLDALLGRLAAGVEAADAGRFYRASWLRVMSGDPSGTADRRLVIVTPDLDLSKPASRGRALGAIRDAARALPTVAAGGAEVRLSGQVAMEQEELASVASGVAAGGVVAFLAVIAVLYMALRSLRMVLASIVSLVVGLIGTAGFAALAVGHLNLISIAFAVLYIGLGIDFSIHLCSRFREMLAAGYTHADALPLAASDVGVSIILCAVTTSIGFFAFAPSSFSGVAELGVISGVGMYVSLLVTLTVLPALLMLISPRRPPTLHAVRSTALGRVGRGVTRHARWVRYLALLLAVLASVAALRVEFNPDPMSLRDPSSEAMRTYAALQADETTAPSTLAVLANDRSDARARAERLRALPEVARVRWLESYVPEKQDDKLAQIGDLGMLLGPSLGRLVLDSVDQQRDVAALRELTKALRTHRARGAQQLRAALDAWLDQPVTSPRLQRLAATLLGTLPGALDRLESSLTASRVARDALPPELVASWRSAAGRYRLEVVPSADISDNAQARQFVRAVESVASEATGAAAVQVKAGATVVVAFVEALTLALVSIALLLLALTRSLARTAVIMAPLLLAAVSTTATAALLGVPFNYANVITLPLLLGVGVDNGIHMDHRHRVAPPLDGNLLATGTARAIVFSALTTAVSFGSLMLSQHPGTASMGTLLTIGMVFAVAATLIVLPALLLGLRRT